MDRRDLGAALAATTFVALFLAVRAVASRIGRGANKHIVTVVAIVVTVALLVSVLEGLRLIETVSPK